MRNLINYLKEYFEDFNLKDITLESLFKAASNSTQNR